MPSTQSVNEDVEEEDRHEEEQGRTKLVEGVPPGQAGDVEQAGDGQQLRRVDRHPGDREERQELRSGRQPVDDGVAGHVERQHHAIARTYSRTAASGGPSAITAPSSNTMTRSKSRT